MTMPILTLQPHLTAFAFGTGRLEASTSEEGAEPKGGFWAPLAKLQASPAVSSSDAATEAAIADAKRQAGGKKRR